MKDNYELVVYARETANRGRDVSALLECMAGEIELLRSARDQWRKLAESRHVTESAPERD